MPPVFPVTGSSLSPVQKPQLWLADHCARVNVDKPGTFSDKTAGALAASVYCGQGEFPVPFGLPVLAKLVQAATSSSESAVSCALKVAGWFTPRTPPCQFGNRNWMSIVCADQVEGRLGVRAGP